MTDHDVKSLRTRDRDEAERKAKKLARRIAELELRGGAPERITLAQLGRLYLHHRGKLLSQSRVRHVKQALDLLEELLGADFEVADFSQHYADTYVNARQSGELKPDDRRASDAPADGTVRNELAAFSTVCNWGCTFRRGGRPLLGFNPMKGVELPKEDNPSRPIATEARHRGLLAQADEADPDGRFRCLLILAWETGRRINALVHLRASDVLLSENRVRRVLAEEGMDESLADHWPWALRWRPEWDKCDYLDVSPISEAAKDALEAYLRRHPVVGEGWLFPANEDPSEPLDKLMASYYLTRAEELAGLPHQKRGGWHAFRRAWATRRKHLPVKDVMRAGGWRTVEALQNAYQGADPETTRRVVELR